MNVVYLPPSVTDLLQPLDICVYQQTSKKFLKEISGMVCWGNFYTTKITGFYFRWTIDPVDLSLAVTKQLCSKWILEMIKYISTSLQMIVKGSVWAGISKPLDEGSSSPGSGIVVGKIWAKAPVKMIILTMQIQTVILVRRKQNVIIVNSSGEESYFNY